MKKPIKLLDQRGNALDGPGCRCDACGVDLLKPVVSIHGYRSPALPAKDHTLPEEVTDHHFCSTECWLAWLESNLLTDPRWMAPAETITSPSLRARFASPPCRYSTPMARRFSIRRRVTWAPVSTRRLGRRLAACGVADVRHEGVSDLAVGDRKLGGSCIWRTRGLVYYSTTLLVNPDLTLMERYLPHPPREPAYRRGRSHADFVTSVAALGGETDPDRLRRCLAEATAHGLSALLSALPHRV